MEHRTEILAIMSAIVYGLRKPYTATEAVDEAVLLLERLETAVAEQDEELLLCESCGDTKDDGFVPEDHVPFRRYCR